MHTQERKKHASRGLLSPISPQRNLPLAVSGRSPSTIHAHSLKSLVRCSQGEARALIPLEYAERHLILPLSIQKLGVGEAVLAILSSAPLSHATHSELRFLSGMALAVEEVGDADMLLEAIRSAYRGDSLSLRNAVNRVAHSLPAQAVGQRESDHFSSLQQAAVPQLLEALLIRAHYLQASDIHIEPCFTSARVRFRVDGLLREETSVRLSMEALQNLARHIKVLCRLDLTESRRPQDGSFSKIIREGMLRVRASLLPQQQQERIVLRIFPCSLERNAQSKESPLEDLGLTANQRRVLLGCLGLSGGSLLFSGPTGSGKSTLLYACLEHLNEEWRSIVTIEDPVERLIPGVNQTQVSSQVGVGDFLPPLLRQDPDVLMIGEIRDAKTAETALTAGITGHLVLSTVHAGSCLEILPRLQFLGVSGLLLGSSLRLLSSQRLVQRNCLACKRALPCHEAFGRLFQLSPEETLWQGAGCEACHHTGVQGRQGVYEFLPVTAQLQEAFLGSGSTDQAGALLSKARFLAQEMGFQPLAHHVRELLLAGIISPDSACRALGIESRFYKDDSLW